MVGVFYASAPILPYNASMSADQTTLGIDVGGTSVKLAAIRDGNLLWSAKVTYCKPTGAKLLEVVREATAGRAQDIAGVGLCVPGLLDEQRERVTFSANVPGLHEIRLEELAIAAAGQRPAAI